MNIPNIFSKIKFTLFDNNTATIHDDNNDNPNKILSILRVMKNETIDYHTFGAHAYLRFSGISKLPPVAGTQDEDSNTYDFQLKLTESTMTRWIKRYSACDIPRCRISLNKIVTHKDGDNADYSKDYIKHLPLYITVLHIINHCNGTSKGKDDIKAAISGFLVNMPDTVRATELVFNRLYRSYEDLTRRVFEYVDGTPVSEGRFHGICGTLNPFDPEDDYNKFSENVRAFCEETDFGDIAQMRGGNDYFRSEPFNAIKALMFKNIYQLMLLDVILWLFKENEMALRKDKHDEEVTQLISEYDALTRIMSVVNKLAEKVGLPYISSGDISNKAPRITVDSSNGCCVFKTPY